MRAPLTASPPRAARLIVSGLLVLSLVAAVQPALGALIGPNSAPSAADDDYYAAEGELLVVGIPGALSNDTDANGDLLTAQQASSPQYGTLTFLVDGSFTYLPNGEFEGTD
nr:cadherin-like domain-containing protein [Chloroflexota bacterium]